MLRILTRHYRLLLFAFVVCLTVWTADNTLLLRKGAASRNALAVSPQNVSCSNQSVLTSQDVSQLTSADLTVLTSLNSNNLKVQVRRSPTNNFARFVFFAGLGGTGHHGWQMVMQKSAACKMHWKIDATLRDLWYGNDDTSDANYKSLVTQMRDVTQLHINRSASQLYCLNVLSGGSMLSYPDKNSKLYHPDLVSLSRAAVEAAADLRVIVLHRDPAPMLVSLSINRKLLPLALEAQQMANQAAILYSQLSTIDPNYFLCAPFGGTVARADQISDFIVGGLGTSFADNIRKYYVDKKDDIEAAQLKIKEHASQISTRVKTLDYFYHLILKICSSRTPKVSV